ncbi:phosphoethanolamine--lipid A transferase [Stenotrophomonas sp. HITSZ_GD]|uniref:phosphoethanolamine transferase n=1 Tax=Stenotrophomonas sp. HITSZ_GD TaxID=3037248 RepID=UPI00240D4530|nr:phosphoethanolamine--lipid A transferase [Stenotrophomonas sp. HITSZ_GD]MDG2524928.1 phosphoethanolamine--lipid A transferase [Stenotrophomonas sp. HITSZ_GD]
MSLSISSPAWRRWLRDIDWRWRPTLSTEGLILATSLFFALACNGLFWRSATAWSGGGIGMTLSLLAVLVAVHALLLGLLVWRWNAKVLLSVLLLSTALTTYYMSRYNVYIDADMLRNVLATDRKESRELITASLLLPLLCYGVLPVLVLWRLRLRQRRPVRALLVRAGFLLAVAVGGAAAAMLSFQDLSALMRNHHEIRYLATPINTLAALRANLKSATPGHKAPKLPIGEDAMATPRAPQSRPRLLLIVLGETMRAQNFGLDGYARQTTPELAQVDGLVNFPDMHSCGTSTEVSVPCMFSPWGRHDYNEDRIRGHQSLLHVLDRAGVGVLWRDNQSGCKGVCDGLPIQQLDDAKVASLCQDGRCMDEVLLDDLAAQVRARPGDRVVVLHQLGNHGPSYYERYPAAFARFNPACQNPDLGQCSRQQIVDAYDNAVLYTDHFLGRAIGALRAMPDYDTAMIYLSDHGESLGEKGLYLHGVPYAIAPQEQTHVPMVMWFSPQFAKDRGLDVQCLRRRAAGHADHDNLFPSVLGLMQVRTSLYDSSRDLFAGCQQPA